MGDSSEIDYEKVKSGLEDKSIILLDVRTKEERTEKHGAIPGSKHIWGKLFTGVGSILDTVAKDTEDTGVSVSLSLS